MVAAATILLSAQIATAAVQEKDIDICASDSDCIVVPYHHCCGLNKRAINKAYRSLYDATPAWQELDNVDTCARIGVCPASENEKYHAACIMQQSKPGEKRCELTR